MNNKLFTKLIKKKKIQKREFMESQRVFNSFHNVWTIRLHLRNDRVQENQQNYRIKNWDRYLWYVETDYQANKYKNWLTFMVEFTWSIFHTRLCKEPTCWTDYKNLQVVAALRSATLISLQVVDDRRFWYRVGVGVSVSVLITIPESDWFCGSGAGLKY